ncbi:glycosyl hydrolase [Hymenobacter profundi]|uniref:Carbohydrate-binding protein n=1 Tax=Hymenobacter profundi TaxID=1982110 RepID=A0ABS6X1G9_9BACT|nr:glycosyl hydrolase [Hymenobacter profundi]MBW3129676.1 carbohydrate-binding protein [Hymenobacter profundi]
MNKLYKIFHRQATGWLLGAAALLSCWPQQATAQTKSAKRGIAYGYHSAADMQALAPGISWWYNWYSKPEAGAASVYTGLGIDYAPMQWGRDLDGTPFTADRLAANIPAGAKYLLGFNEPNFRSQANLTPTQAAALWPTLQEVARRKNLKLVSPAVNYCGDCVAENGTIYYSPTQYLDAFFAACPTCQVDYIAVHTYVCEEQWLRDKIGELKKYGKPIWLTEFSCGDMPQNHITLDVQKRYLTAAVNYLENEPAVFRYAWFSGRNNEIPNINLLGGASGQLTELGQLYVNLPFSGSTPTPTPTRLTPVAAVASSSENSGTTAAKAIDGNLTSRWASAFADPQYLQLDLGTVKDISRVKINWEAAYGKDYQLQTSLDGSSWTAIHSVINGDGGIDDITGLAGRGRYLRIYGTRRATTYGYSIYEVEVYGPAAVTSTTINLEAESYSSMSGVQTQTTTDTGGGQNVGYIDAGDWMAYSNITFPTTGTYTIEYRVASPSGGTLSSDFNSGSTQLGKVTIPATGGWQTWTTVSQTVSVAAGTYSFGVFAQTGGWNLNWMRISQAGSSVTAKATATASITAAPTVQLYPNPVTDKLHLVSTLPLAGSQYQITDAYGLVNTQGTLSSSNELNVSSLRAGVYTLLIITKDQQRTTLRLVKE